jgi:hypothetical protein
MTVAHRILNNEGLPREERRDDLPGGERRPVAGHTHEEVCVLRLAQHQVGVAYDLDDDVAEDREVAGRPDGARDEDVSHDSL